MKKVLLFTLLGFGIFLAGIGVAFIYFQGSQSGTSSPFLLIPAIALGGVGVFFLFKAGRIDTQKVIFKDSITKEPDGLITKNNKLVAEWNKTNEARDRLKMIEVTSAAQTKSDA